MKNLTEIEERVDAHLKDDFQCLMVQTCGGVHPLMLWHPKYYKKKHKAQVLPLTEKSVNKKIREYLPFAWKKANGERGISSERSIWKFKQWLWLLEDSEILAFASDNENYPFYGKPILAQIEEKYGERQRK